MNYLTLTSDCLEMLYMLPKLKDIKFSFCNLDNPEAVLENFERIKQLNSTTDSGKYGARVESIYFDNVGFERDGYWPIEIVIAIAAAAPNIKSIKFDDATPELLSTIREHLPNVDLPLGGL
ncbi:hypothetical protein GQ42DRAFT_82047 [Ramicandelaber brevisporus]|nr:hypothetical protein GQ42DRAFT_82047 [Ramicandelaber brevisporus]